MILEKKNNKIETSGVLNKSSFTFEASGHGFRAIAENLYSNPIKSILQEMGQNQADSHAAAGKAHVPFEIYLPNEFDPVLKFKDYGVGMSHDFMMSEYTKVFHSTKNNSNNQSGAYGIGRVSPLSVTDNYSITSIKDGKIGIYSVYYDESDFPCVSCLSFEDTEEENGVTVSIPIRYDLFSKIYSEIPKVFKYYKVKPTILGKEGIQVEGSIYKLSGSDWGITSNHESFAIMGFYGYPINYRSISNLNPTHLELLKCGVNIEFDMGEVKPSTSREELNYNEKTCDSIKNKLDKILQEIKLDIAQKFQTVQTEWEARCLCYEISRGDLRFLTRVLGSSYCSNWNGKDVSENSLTIKDIKIQHYSPKFNRRSSLYTMKHNSVNWVSCHVKNFYVCDAKNVQKRLNQLVKDCPDTGDILLIDTKDQAKLVSLIGGQNIEFKKISDLAEPPKVVRNKVNLGEFWEFGFMSKWRPSSNFDKVNTLTSNSFYIIRDRYDIFFGYEQIDHSKTNDVISFLKSNTTHQDITVYAITKKQEEKFKKEGVKSLFGVCGTAMEDYFKKNQKEIQLNINFISANAQDFKNLESLNFKTKNDSIWNEFRIFVDNAKAPKNGHKLFFGILNIFKNITVEPQTQFDFKRICAQYPMIKALDYSFKGTGMNQIIEDYINLVENSVDKK